MLHFEVDPELNPTSWPDNLRGIYGRPPSLWVRSEAAIRTKYTPNIAVMSHKAATYASWTGMTCGVTRPTTRTPQGAKPKRPQHECCEGAVPIELSDLGQTVSAAVEKEESHYHS